MDWLTQDNLNSLFLALIIGWRVVSWILERLAPKTETTLDDRLLAGMKSAESVFESDWVKRNAPAFWQQAEMAGKAGELGTGLAKLAHYLLVARRAYQHANGRVLSVVGETQLETTAAALSFQEKLLRDTPASLPLPGAAKE